MGMASVLGGVDAEYVSVTIAPRVAALDDVEHRSGACDGAYPVFAEIKRPQKVEKGLVLKLRIGHEYEGDIPQIGQGIGCFPRQLRFSPTRRYAAEVEMSCELHPGKSCFIEDTIATSDFPSCTRS